MNTATTALVAAPPDTVFGLLVDVDRLPEWNEVITRVLHRPARVEPGAEWVVEMHAMGQTWPSRTRVEAIDRADRRLVYLVVHLRRRALAREVPASIRALEAAARVRGQGSPRAPTASAGSSGSPSGRPTR